MSVIWKDGKFLDGTQTHISHEDVGLFNGLAVFDSMLADRGLLIDAREHFDRLVHDAEIVLGITSSWLPMFSQMTDAWLPLLSKNRLGQDYARVKTIVTGGLAFKPLTVSNVPSVIISVSKCDTPSSHNPVSCAVIRQHLRVAGSVLENCKRVDYTRSFAARRIAQEIGADEAILMNTEGHIACAATSNIFIEENGILITPPLRDGVLAGITRANIIRDKGAIEESITEERLRSASKVYLTNSFTGMREVSKII